MKIFLILVHIFTVLYWLIYVLSYTGPFLDCLIRTIYVMSYTGSYLKCLILTHICVVLYWTISVMSYTCLYLSVCNWCEIWFFSHHKFDLQLSLTNVWIWLLDKPLFPPLHTQQTQFPPFSLLNIRPALSMYTLEMPRNSMYLQWYTILPLC